MELHRRSAPALGINTEKAKLIVGFNTAGLILATIAVLLRVYARQLKRISFVLEDYLVFFALLGFYTQAILTYCAVILGGAGHHQHNVSPANVETSLQMLAGQGICYGIAMTASKWSICLLYKRIFALRWFRIATYIIMFLIFVWGVLAFTVTWAWCSPIEYGWDKTIKGGSCANLEAGYLAVGIIDAITDVFIFVLPLPMIYNLQIPRIKQLSLLVIFSIAALSIIVAAVRAYCTSKVESAGDFTDTRSLMDIFSAIEPATSIIVASSLVLGPVVRLWFGRVGFTTKASSTPTHPKISKLSFHRMDDSTEGGDSSSRPSDDIELGITTTAEQGPQWATLADALEGNGLKEGRIDSMQRTVVQEGRGINVQKDVTVQQGQPKRSRLSLESQVPPQNWQKGADLQPHEGA